MFGSERGRILTANTPNAAVFRSVSPRHLLAQLLIRHINRMLDELAVEINDIERTVWPGRQVDRMEPVVGRGQELFFCFLLTSTRDKRRTGLLQLAPSDEVRQRLADEGIAGIRRPH